MRDRAGPDADGARQGAPDAIQVADRFHLLANVGEALERVLARKRPLTEAATAVNRAHTTTAPAATDPAGGAVATIASTVRTDATRAKQADRATRFGRYQAVVALDRQGLSQKDIARRVGVGRKTVRRFLRAGVFPERAHPARRRTILDPDEPYLRERWTAGCRNSLQLWREIHARGFHRCGLPGAAIRRPVARDARPPGASRAVVGGRGRRITPADDALPLTGGEQSHDDGDARAAVLDDLQHRLQVGPGAL